MRLPRTIYEQIIDQAVTEWPNECCGLIGARDGLAVSRHPMRNVADDPSFLYLIDPGEQFDVQAELDARDLELGSIYHSHPRSQPYPSGIDLSQAFYPEAIYIIVGLAKVKPRMCAYNIRAGEVSSARVTVID